MHFWEIIKQMERDHNLRVRRADWPTGKYMAFNPRDQCSHIFREGKSESFRSIYVICLVDMDAHDWLVMPSLGELAYARYQYNQGLRRNWYALSAAKQSAWNAAAREAAIIGSGLLLDEIDLAAEADPPKK